jgi:two-component system OmpR family sensor kinase
VQYGLPLSLLNSDLAGLDVLLILGVLAGTALAFGGGWLVARRAITPIAELTAAASEIERTGDPTLTLPDPTADDEVAELTRTLTTMLASLADARGRTESALERQRAFVADASHELRTPLTSVLANLELLEVSLAGQDRELARSALRSTQRMRRLVADLLLLARSDVNQPATPQPADLAELVVAAAAELEPASEDHELELDIQPAPLLGNPDDLQRVAINLIENAIRHTPPGTHIRASTRTLRDGRVELVVADDGPGIAADVKKHMFERPPVPAAEQHHGRGDQQRAHEEGVHQDPDREAEADRAARRCCRRRSSRRRREHREGAAEDQAGRGDGRAGAADRLDDRLAQRQLRASSRIRVITRML